MAAPAIPCCPPCKLPEMEACVVVIAGVEGELKFELQPDRQSSVTRETENDAAKAKVVRIWGPFIAGSAASPGKKLDEIVFLSGG